MKNLGKGILSTILLKMVTNPVGLAVLIVIFIFLISTIFFVFPKSENFNLSNPESNKDILQGNTPNSFYAACQEEGEMDKNLMRSEFENAGVFAGKEDVFIDVAERYHFDPILLSAIAFHETGYGTSELVVHNNNPGGLYNSSERSFYHFDSLEQGLDAMTKNLAENYYGEGLFTIEEIGNKYAPIGVENDPTNLNAHWIPTVTDIVNNLGGLVMHCEVISDSEFIFPISNPYVTSDFGYRIHPIEGTVKMHGGTDFDCDIGDNIYATNGGEVVYSQFNHGGFGNLVIIEHPGNIYSAYAHLSELTVGVEDVVEIGQEVGRCGSTGDSTGPHLHFEIQLNQMFGQRVDPMDYLLTNGN